MEISFNAQPFDDGCDLSDFLDSVAADTELVKLDIIVAWAKRSGLGRVRNHLETIRDRVGAETRLIVGIDEGGATEQGLRLSLELFTRVYVFHDRSGRTFHPKIYAAWGSSHGRLLVGSNNLTAGGVYYNYEAALDCVLTWPADEPLKASVSDYVKRLLRDSAVCLELTDERLRELTKNPKYRVGDEDFGQRSTTVSQDADIPEDLDTTPGLGKSMFGLSAHKKRKDPAATISTGSMQNVRGTTRAATTPQDTSSSSGPASSVVVQRWYKKMSHSDAQQPKTPVSNVKGHVTLGKATHPIDSGSWFRERFFDSLHWATTSVANGTRDIAELVAEVFVEDTSKGTFQMEIDHQESRISNQANVPTWLHWKDFGRYLREHDHVNDFVTLERLVNGQFRVIISNSPIGRFIDGSS